MCWIGVDPGSVRCGVAVADPTDTLATPLCVLPTEPRATLAQRLAVALGHRWPKGLVVGLPLNQRGEEGEAAFQARQIGELLAEGLGLDAHYIDERFSTREAVVLRREAVGATGRGKRKLERVDLFAATAILQAFLDRRRGPAAPG